MGYSIGQVAEKMGLTAHTLRYYEKEGLLPFVKKTGSGLRIFSDEDIGWLQMKKPGTAVCGTVLGCVLLLAVALGVLAALATSPESTRAPLPMLDLACRLGAAGVVYAVLLFLGMFGTSVSSLVAVLTYAGQKSAWLAGHRTALLLVLTAAAFAGSLFGFGDLIGTVYPVYGYLGMAAMLLVAEHAVHARRAGNNRAATGD